MDWFWAAIGVLFLAAGFVGCIVPVLPGPPLAFLALLCLLPTSGGIGWNVLVLGAAVAAAATVADYVVPAIGTKKFGGSKAGTWGCVAGTLVGLWFAPLGIIAGPFIGAVLGELAVGRRGGEAFKAGLGAFLGFVAGVILKFIACGYIAWKFFDAIF